MKTRILLLTAALAFSLGSRAQMTDVTAQYITNADFEACDALPTIVVPDYKENVDVNVIQLYLEQNVAKGTDYAAQGWQLVAQEKNANGGVVTYGCNIQVGKWVTVGEPGPPAGITGTKGLCFCGSKGLIYQQANEITLPAGIYRLTVNLYARNGQTTNPGPTQQVTNVKTGFMPTGKTEDDLMPAVRKSMQFKSNAWDTEVIDIELTAPTTGRFQICYGSSYFVMVDDVKLEYQGGVVTSALQSVVTKAETLNTTLANNTLTAAIASANAFIENPTSQEDVEPQINTLYEAMATALSATTQPVDITAAYIVNPSFETGKIEPWAWGNATGTVGTPTNAESVPYIDAANVVEFATAGSNQLTQVLPHLPAGYYALTAKLNQKATLMLGSASTLCQGGKEALYLRCFPTFYQAASTADITIGAKASAAFRIDDIHVIYGKDEASLMAEILKAVKADGEKVLGMSDFDIVTGSERSNLTTLLKGTEANNINTAINAFVNAKDSYTAFQKAKKNAAAYTLAAYPYADKTIYDEIQALIAATPTSGTDAESKAEQLTADCLNLYVSNAYCEGVADRVDHTAKIAGANATGTDIDAKWTVENIQIRTDKTAWNDPKTKKADKNVYGVTADYYRTAKDKTAYMAQTLSGLPKGTYVLSVTMMANKSITPVLKIDGETVAELPGIGTSAGGVYGAGWIEQVVKFTKDSDGDMELRIESTGTANYVDWYVDNLRLYELPAKVTAITEVKTNSRFDGNCYDLTGRRIKSAVKGQLFIKDGKKIIK